ncbi:F-box protein At4g18380-like [Olea europaea var. sylvestris]|uniref:F-box At4g18380-like n=1 Tax=Olea europaea subsp. europaea TaxID=158383 RepID=A0A8S0T4I4_OLEEU|nr:F-box protein At4g18380-like [Olea europaea var. sylvestris]CAA2999761.1 F-box At4g18380-like [Olea europaea subsp. europaea]
MNSTQEIIDSDNLFDRLPDDIVLSIFSKLGDAKSLCISLCVCKRFRSINLETDQIFLSIPRKRTLVRDCETHSSFFKNLVFRILIKSVRFISQRTKFEKNKNDDEDYCSYYPPSEVLKSFQEIRLLHLRLPCHGSEKLVSKARKKSNSTFLKWKAEFGSQLNNCVILGAKSWIEKPENGESLLESDSESSVIDDHELKLRIVWTISCLMAASARHYLIQEIVKEREMIEKIEVSDESEQGRLCMNKEQIEELRSLKERDTFLRYRMRVPALKMKIWYMKKLELPESGEVLEGATLVVVRPVGGGGDYVDGGSGGDLVAEVFDGAEEVVVLGEVVKKLMGAKCYTLEMNSF